ncbi:hypothetical protein HMPREF6485_2170 [Segatella buccae ATCC 33574]|uniref:Uncharacterized protein n=1 Tax=Segatella buccae ATCC 33574 TaxID=873513 RepID=E6K984_9BACT|nr:hypothetical protein HMPREF6485_2170 [Segatella buccae ATCC 33574]
MDKHWLSQERKSFHINSDWAQGLLQGKSCASFHSYQSFQMTQSGKS